ncbi:zinc knuckle CX2CX4HX4C containing protein, partial [Tanacetum coccineum]
GSSKKMKKNTKDTTDQISKRKKMKENTKDTLDRISTLPDFIVHHILSYIHKDTKSQFGGVISDPVVQSVNINTKSTSYAGAACASAKDQPIANSNFRPLVADHVFNGVNISIPRKVVEKKQLGETWAKKDYDEYQRLFFFKFHSCVGLEAVLEGGPWLIRNSPIILKKWSMDTRLLKEELTRIPIWIKLHDVPLQVFEEDGRSSLARCLIEVNSEVDLVDVVTIGIPSLIRDGFTKETICVEYEWRPPRCDICKIFGHVHDHCPKKMVSPPIVTTSNIVTPTVEKTNDGFQTVGNKKKRKGKYEPKAATSEPKKGANNVGNASKSSSLKFAGTSSKKGNITTSNSYSVLENEEEEEEEHVENVYDESANLFPNLKTGESLTFTAAAG